MEENKELIWAYLSMKKETYDNDYYFYEDGKILHHYDRTMSKLNIEEFISPSNISDIEKEKILSKCKEECTEDILNKIKTMLL